MSNNIWMVWKGSPECINAYIVKSHCVQKMIIICFIFALFWNGLFAGIPRADQVIYFHLASQFDSLRDILFSSPSWNRAILIGDIALYRPVLFLLLGMFYHFFGYNFVLWQVADLLLHTAVVLGVHKLLCIGRLRSSIVPILLSILFASTFIGSELVLWNHICGYLLFSVLVVFMIYYLIIYLRNSHMRHLVLSFILGIIAQFTYELGVILNLLLSFFFIARIIFSYYGTFRSNTKTRCGRKDLVIAFIFLAIAFIYPVISITDLHRLDMINLFHSTELASSFSLANMIKAIYFSLLQVLFWIGGCIFPSFYKIVPGSRTLFIGFVDDFHAAQYLNFYIVLLLFISGIAAVSKRGINLVGAGIAFSFSIIFLFLYSLMIAFGRAVPRGLDYVLETNLYYGYIACLSVIVGIALISIMGREIAVDSKAASEEGSESYFFPFMKRKRSRAIIHTSILICLIFLIFLNAASVHQLTYRYRYEYAPSLQAQIDTIQGWLAGEGKNPDAYFSVASCDNNKVLSWLEPHLLRGLSGKPTLADGLFPEKSYALHKSLLKDKTGIVITDICHEPVISASSQHAAYGPEGLFQAVDPGWHSETPVRFPQSLTIDFQKPQKINAMEFLPQTGYAIRSPKKISIESSADGSSWVLETIVDNIHNKDHTDRWSRVNLTRPIYSQFIRIIIYSNCGDPDFLTLKGLRVY